MKQISSWATIRVPILPENRIATGCIKSDAFLWILLAVDILTPGPIQACRPVDAREVGATAGAIGVHIAKYRCVSSSGELQSLNRIFFKPVEMIVHIIMLRVLNDL